jgi:hypothetical protein
MKCENCGTKIRKWDAYCPKCGMELFSSESKPLKSKYLRGEYREEEEVAIVPYDLESDDLSKAAYHDSPYQNQDDYQHMDYSQYDEDANYQTGSNRDNIHNNQEIDYNKKNKKKYNNKKYNRNKNYQKNYNPEGYQKKKYRGYDLDEYYGTEETGSSVWRIFFLLLIVALIFGFVMGLMFFSIKV